MTLASTAPNVLSAPRVIGEVRTTLGEGLCWSVREQALYWVDILEHRLYRRELATQEQREWSFDETISAVAERDHGAGLAIMLRRGLALLDLESGRLTRLDEPEIDRPGNRFNDGKCDGRGRFWGGTMDFDASAPTGALYRFDAQGRATRAADLGWAVTNGPTWSLDGRTMFFNDTVKRRIVAFAFDAEAGELGASRDWLLLPERDGHPDGMTTDATGRLWIAHWGGSCVSCHEPVSGTELVRIELPTPHITNVSFGGPDLTTLYITSATVGLTPAQCSEQPLAGALFAVEVDAIGLPSAPFAG